MSFHPIPEGVTCGDQVDLAQQCNPIVGSPNLLSGKVEYFQYGYSPAKGTSVIFTLLFGLSCLLHIIFAFVMRYRKKSRMGTLAWWLFPTLVVGALTETIGWAGRAQSAFTVRWFKYLGGAWESDNNGFLQQICCLIIAPAFFAAWNYIVLGIVIERTKQADGASRVSYSSFDVRSYKVVFITGDVLSLLVQAAGGGIAATASTESGSNLGAQIMVAGVFIQLVVMVAYTGVLMEFYWRLVVKKRASSRSINLIGWCCCACARKPSVARKEAYSMADAHAGSEDQSDEYDYMRNPRAARNTRLLLFLCMWTTLLLFIRSIYRSVELLDGWSGPIITNQQLFNWLDGTLMLLLIWTYNIFHPGWFL